MVTQKDIKVVLLCLACFFGALYIFKYSPSKQDALRDYVIDQNKAQQIIIEEYEFKFKQSEAEAQRLRVELKNSNRKSEKHQQKIIEAVESNDVHVLDSAFASIKRHGAPRQR